MDKLIYTYLLLTVLPSLDCFQNFTKCNLPLAYSDVSLSRNAYESTIILHSTKKTMNHNRNK
ncbi:hypothetical protein [Flavobacterium soyangense]|uniref:hypothetical protein n=1 Tax=Flavobacterium soyangense TaxID=2023265 RepID=UPI001889B738|nr:hypothetical protein [Flavobacterium soyangense]